MKRKKEDLAVGRKNKNKKIKRKSY